MRELEALEFLKAHRVEALVLLGTALDGEALGELGIPVLAFGQRVEGPKAWSLCLDNQQAAYEATRYLIDRGHTRIVHISSHRGGMDVRDRLLGYRKAMREAGLRARVVYGDLEEEGGYRAAAEAFRRYPDTTAIFAANDQTAFGARLYLYEQGLRVPEDVSSWGLTTSPLAPTRSPAHHRAPAHPRHRHRPGPRAPGGPRGEVPTLPRLELRLVERASVREVRA